MSKWNEFCESVKGTTKKTADKTKNIANLASLRAKLSKLEVEAAEEYDTLGRIYYLQEVGKVDNREAIAVEIRYISDINKQMNALKAEIREIKRLEAEAKAAAEAEREAKRAAREAAKAAADIAEDADEAVAEEIAEEEAPADAE